jgi:tetratricopeptide (TPR) repeat protein
LSPRPRTAKHKWAWKARFRAHAFGWRSQPAISRVREAVAEIKKAAKKDRAVAAEGAVEFLERVSAAIEQVDSSSGAMGSAVNWAVAELVAVIAEADVDAPTHRGWLERLWEAYQNDQIPYIECLGDRWGEVCASKEVASEWANRLMGTVKMSWSPDPTLRGFFKGTTNCLSALVAAERHDEVLALLKLAPYKMWDDRQYGVRALAAQGRIDEAIRYAEEDRGLNDSQALIAQLCEELLLAAGRHDEAYRRYAIPANRAGTYLATFRAVAKKYPSKGATEILGDLVQSTPGDEGKWFAAAKEAGLYEEALALASRAPCDPKTLTRAARDFAGKEPTFALGAGLLALHWLVQGYGYEITGADVWAAYNAMLTVASDLGQADVIRDRVRKLVASETLGDRFVTKVLGRELRL